MELAFEKSNLAFLDCTIRETRGQEETAEVIVPDSYPDAERVICASASCMLRSKECRAGSIVISGAVRANALYAPEDGSWPRMLEAYIPFSVRFDHPAADEQTQVICGLTVRQADARLVNSRKLLIRVGIGCQLAGYEAKTQEICTLKSAPETLQTRTQTYPLCLPLMTGEKAFVISENVELGGAEEVVAQIIWYRCEPEITDRKLVGRRAVFKGNLVLHLLYENESHALLTLERRIPFSQYCELSEDADDDTLSVSLSVTGAELEADSEGKRLLLSVSFVTQCLVTGMRNVQVTEDAYAIGAVFTPQWQQTTLRCILDRQTPCEQLGAQIAGEVSTVICCQADVDAPQQQRADGRVRISVPVNVHLLYLDSSGALQCAQQRTESVYEAAVGEGTQCTVSAQIDNTQALLSSGGAEVRAGVCMTLEFTAEQTLRSLCGGTLEEAAYDAARPSAILRVCPGGTTLWELGKQYEARADAIAGANHLSGDTVPEEMLLLIPMR